MQVDCQASAARDVALGAAVEEFAIRVCCARGLRQYVPHPVSGIHQIGVNHLDRVVRGDAKIALLYVAVVQRSGGGMLQGIDHA